MSFQSTELSSFVDRLARHSALTRSERACLLSLPWRSRTISRNQDFVHGGDLLSAACFVASGMVARIDIGSDGTRQITALHLPGDMPDLHSLVQPEASTGLQALGPTTILQIAHCDLRKAAADFPAIAEAFWRDCAIDVAILAQWIVNIGRRCALARIAHLLCEIAWRTNSTGDDVRFRLPMTQVNLGEACGITPVHVNRTLTSLKALGTTLQAKTVEVNDWPALAEIGQFDPRYLQAGLKPAVAQRIAA